MTKKIKRFKTPFIAEWMDNLKTAARGREEDGLNKKSTKINKRRFKRAKNKLWKNISKQLGITGRVKTHAPGFSCGEAWMNFHRQIRGA